MLKTKIRAPFFELGPKNYIIGKKVEDLAHTIRKTAEKYDIRVLYSVPFFHTEKVAEIFEGSEHTAMSQLLLWMISQRAAKMAWPSLNVL